jgi:hypothetical protein
MMSTLRKLVSGIAYVALLALTCRIGPGVRADTSRLYKECR